MSSITRQRSPLSHSSLSYASSSSPPLNYDDVPSHGSSLSPSYTHPSSAMPSSTPYSNSTLASSYSSNYESPHHAPQSRQSLPAYTFSTPVQLPPLPSSRYPMNHDHISVGSTDSYRTSHLEENAAGGWFRKNISLAMFKVCKCLSLRPSVCSPHIISSSQASPQEAPGTGLSPGGSGGMSLAQPHSMGSLAMRRMTPSSLSGAGIGAQSGIPRSGRAEAWP